MSRLNGSPIYYLEYEEQNRNLENREFNSPQQKNPGQEIRFKGLAHPLPSYKQRITNDLIWSNDKPYALD